MIIIIIAIIMNLAYYDVQYQIVVMDQKTGHRSMDAKEQLSGGREGGRY